MISHFSVSFQLNTLETSSLLDNWENGIGFQYCFPFTLLYKHGFMLHFIDYAVTLVPFFPPFVPLCPAPPPSTSIPHALSSCPWVVHISSLASPFPILFLTSPCLFCAYELCFLFSVTFPLQSLLPPLH